ncbi:MAG: NAD(P)-dependent oxidoreductase [Thomasclavelia sp.]|nr:NAD(P)-dependent oxidoreductase [Thomasclavelia sp.]
MKLVDGMKDEKLGLALLYNFTKGYDIVPMKIYDIVLPLLFNDTFMTYFKDDIEIEECIVKCKQANDNFFNEILNAYQEDKEMTQNALGIGMLQKDLSFEVIHNEMCGVANESSILLMKEAYTLGKLLKKFDVDGFIDMMKSQEFKITFLDSNTIGDDIKFDEIKECGNIELLSGIKQEDIPVLIKDSECVITNKYYLGKKELENAKNVKLICVTATGYNNIDVDYCHDHNITVCNVKGYSTSSVVQHTLALVTSLNNKLSFYNDYVKSGKYSTSGHFSYFGEHFNELEGKTWGIVGMGEIGRSVAKIATDLGCNVIYYSTSGKNNHQIYEQVDYKTLLKKSDIITIHAPLSEATVNLFDEASFILMKDSAILVNVGRGKIVNENDLANALINNQILAAALDVFENEPLSIDSKLLTIKDNNKLLLTPHVAWGTVEARNRVIKEVALNIKSYKLKKPRNVC